LITYIKFALQIKIKLYNMEEKEIIEIIQNLKKEHSTIKYQINIYENLLKDIKKRNNNN